MKKLLEIAKDPAYEKVLFMLSLIGCFVFMLAVVALYMIWRVPLNGVELVIGAVIFAFKDLINFKWGSSDGSKEKDNTIKDILNNRNNGGQQGDR